MALSLTALVHRPLGKNSRVERSAHESFGQKSRMTAVFGRTRSWSERNRCITYAYVQFNCTDKLYMWYAHAMSKRSPVPESEIASDLAAQIRTILSKLKRRLREQGGEGIDTFSGFRLPSSRKGWCYHGLSTTQEIIIL